MKSILSYSQKRRLETLIAGVLEPLPLDHTPEQGCRYFFGHDDESVADEATRDLGRHVATQTVGKLRREVFGQILPAEEEPAIPASIEARLAAVEALAAKLHELLREGGFITE